MKAKVFRGNLVDLHQKKIYPAEIKVVNGRIQSITSCSDAPPLYILPGFVDAHIHIESSMLVPTEFAKMAVCHGTVATISDPHEIANVLGLVGVEFMIRNAELSPLKFYFGVPSCVPATSYETAGAELTAEDISYLFEKYNLAYLSEMMNYPGVLQSDPEVIKKLAIAKKYGKPVDGHAPGVTGDEAIRYIQAGISTDHECFRYEEAKWKADHGMKILIREGSAAKNFEALIDLMAYCPDKIMFCSDDKHPDDLMEGHINLLVRRAIEKGYDLFDVLRAASLHPVQHYGMNLGLLRVGDPADFIISRDLTQFEQPEVYIDGECVAKEGVALFETTKAEPINHFEIEQLHPDAIRLKAKTDTIQVIKVLDGELITEQCLAKAKIHQGFVVSDPDRDILQLVVVNRYKKAVPAVAFIQGFGLKRGAIASTVAHDSHNIIAVGVDEASILKAINEIIKTKGGINATDGRSIKSLPLPMAGLMSLASGEETGRLYALIDQYAKKTLGSTLKAPFMSLSFMALLVIPSLKLSDLGLFDGSRFQFTDLFMESS